MANIERMERIFYRAFAFLMGPGAQFTDARAATLQAATDLYGAGSNDARSSAGLDGRRRAVMRLAGRLFMIIVAGCALGTANATAQTAKPLTPWKALVSVNAGAVLAMSPLEQATTLEAYVEPAPITAVVPGEPGAVLRRRRRPCASGRISVSVARSLWWGPTASRRSRPTSRIRSISIDRGRSSGDVNLWRQERAVHANAAWLVDRSPLAYSCSAAHRSSRSRPILVTDIVFDEAFPYDTATFVDAEVEQFDQSAVGFNLGADFTWRLARNWGVGGLVRYSRATVPLSIDGDDAGTLTAGGLSLGGGLRVTF